MVVQVEDHTYHLQEVQDYLDSYLNSYQEENGPLTLEEKRQNADIVVDSFVARGVLQAKAKEWGLTTLTPQEEETLRKNAETAFQEVVDQYAQELSDTYHSGDEEAQEAALSMLRVQGITLESLYQQALTQLVDLRVLERVAGDITTMPEADIAQAYQRYYVAPTQEAYAADIQTYEVNTALYGEPTYFMPEGYRQVEQLTLAYPQDLQQRMDQAIQALEQAYQADCAAEEALYSIQETDGEDTQARADYQATHLAYLEKENAYQALKASGLAEAGALLEDIQRQLSEGATFAEVAAQSDRLTTLRERVHSQSILFSQEYVEAAFALESAGDISPVFADAQGMYFLRYQGEVESGPLPMPQEIREEIESQLVLQARYAVLEALIPTWQRDYSVEEHGELLRVE